jgi:hypothetical protein
MALTTHPHLAPVLKKDESYVSTLSVGLSVPVTVQTLHFYPCINYIQV